MGKINYDRWMDRQADRREKVISMIEKGGGAESNEGGR